MTSFLIKKKVRIQTHTEDRPQEDKKRDSPTSQEKPQKKSTLQAPLKERENTQNKARSANTEIKKYYIKKIIEFKMNLPDSQAKSKEIHRIA